MRDQELKSVTTMMPISNIILGKSLEYGVARDRELWMRALPRSTLLCTAYASSRDPGTEVPTGTDRWSINIDLSQSLKSQSGNALRVPNFGYHETSLAFGLGRFLSYPTLDGALQLSIDHTIGLAVNMGGGSPTLE